MAGASSIQISRRYVEAKHEYIQAKAVFEAHRRQMIARAAAKKQRNNRPAEPRRPVGSPPGTRIPADPEQPKPDSVQGWGYLYPEKPGAPRPPIPPQRVAPAFVLEDTYWDRLDKLWDKLEMDLHKRIFGRFVRAKKAYDRARAEYFRRDLTAARGRAWASAHRAANRQMLGEDDTAEIQSLQDWVVELVRRASINHRQSPNNPTNRVELVMALSEAQFAGVEDRPACKYAREQVPHIIAESSAADD